MSKEAEHASSRLPNDTAGLLQDRIAHDKYDFEAYVALARFEREKFKLDEARMTYERLLKVAPASPAVWIEYAELESSVSEFQRVEQIFTKCLQTVLNVELWSYYLAYIRRMNDLSTGGTQVRATIAQAYEFVLSHVGIDPQAGPIWLDYIHFLKSATTSSPWDEQQNQDQLRRAYQRAVVIPLNNVEQLWKEYDLFENTINKATARKFLSERSPAYMTARACARELLQIIDPIRQTKFPTRPVRSPEELAYVTAWRRWIGWEKQDPLELDDPKQLQARIKYAYKQCLQYCRFFPEMWFDAAAYWSSIGEEDLSLYKEGLEANPRSWLLAFAYTEAEEVAKKGDNVKATFDNLIARNKEDMIALEAEIDEAAKVTDAVKNFKIGAEEESDSDSDEEEAVQDTEALARLEELRARLKAYAEEETTAYIMYMRAMRRLEGIKAARSIFARAIKEPRHTWHIYVASALMEHHCSKDSNVAVKIFSRGLKQHSENPDFVLEYLNFLIAIKDDTNARALFEQASKMEGRKAVKLFERFYEYESMYGDLATAQKLATRMSEIDPSANALTRFGKRFTFASCDPIASRDLGLIRLPTAVGQPVPPVPLSFPPSFGPPPAVRPVTLGASPAPSFVAAPPPPPPLPPAVLGLIAALPPSVLMDSSRRFDAKAILDVVTGLDLEAYKAKQQQASKPISAAAAKRKAAALVPPPEELRALGKHNDTKDIYNAKKRA